MARSKRLNGTGDSDANSSYYAIMNPLSPEKKNHKLKIFLLIFLLLLVIAGATLVVIGILNRHEIIHPENIKEFNMFKAKSSILNDNSMSVELETIIPQKSSNDNTPYCADTSVGKICDSENNRFSKRILVDVQVLDSKVARTVFRDRDNDKRWDVSKIPGFLGQKQPDVMSQFETIGFKQTSDEVFSFSMKDFQTDETIFDTSKRSLIISDKYLEIGFVLPTQILFGLGQHNSQFLLTEGNWTMFNRDRSGSPVANGKGDQQTYGTHPFLMCKTKNNKFIGVLFYNSNAQEVNIKFSDSNKSIITYRTVGGMLDIYYFMAGTADEVIQNYNNLIGKPSLPPFWALGFHQCSWLYNSTDDLRNVVSNYTSNGFLFDTIWSDIPYMHNYIDFSVNQTSFGDIKEFVNDIHSNNMHFVPIIDAGISIESDAQGTNWYDKGAQMNTFIKSMKNPDAFDGNLIGHVWPNHTAFVDFMHPNSTTFWKQGLQYLYDQVPFDGIWLDMNEPSNSCVDENNSYIGECPPTMNDKVHYTARRDLNSIYTPAISVGEFDSIPYSPQGEPLYKRTISMDAYHYDQNGNGTFVQYNTHNLFATQETMATAEFLKGDKGKKPFIVSRDSFVGHGQYGTIWTGDNKATQEDLKLSINQVMLFNIFGIPFVGADICGFSGNTTPELCARWAQVGAFYPFMRNHYSHRKLPQEFYLFADPYLSGMKQSIRQRYSLLKYMYTVLYMSSRTGSPTVRHLMYDYPDLNEMIYNTDSFMFGKSLRITANFDNSTTSNPLKSYFPKGIWVDFMTYGVLLIEDKVKEIELYSGWDYTNLHVKGGSVVPVQDASEVSGVKNTADLVGKGVRLLIVPDANGYAEGDLYLAKGELIQEAYQYFTIIHSKKVIQFKLNDGDSNIQEKLAEIHIVGTQAQMDADFICGLDQNFNPLNLKITPSINSFSNNAYLKITSADDTPLILSTLQSITYGKSGIDPNTCSFTYTISKEHESLFESTYLLSKTPSTPSTPALHLTLTLLNDDTIRATITPDSPRFIVPKTSLNPNYPSSPSKNIKDFISVDTTSSLLEIHEFQKPQNVYWKIGKSGLVFEDLFFLYMNSQVNTNGNLYGLGERVTEFFIKEGVYTTWSRDVPDPYDNGKRPGKNIYGSHPVFFTRQKTGSRYHWGMLNLNANAQDLRVRFSGDLGGQIEHYISGQGIFDLYFFIDHNKPEDVVKSYHKLIGYPLLPPFYSVGWNQCRFGYRNTQELQDVVLNYTDSKFPLDTLWSDIDYMYKYRDFTYNKNGSYKGLDTFVDQLHKIGKYYVPIIDAGIAIVKDGTYPTFDRGKNKGAFILSGNHNNTDEVDNIFYGKVWPGYAAFPDFTKTETNQWWQDELNTFHKEISFDGLWLDMNEASNFCDGACVDKDIVPKEKSVLSNLTYQPGASYMEDKSISLDALHSDGQTELNYHSLFGFMQGIASYKYFTDNNKRPFIISRSTFVGQGKYTSHWLGDNYSRYEYLQYSIPGIYSMNLFGINFSGSDICGFIYDVTDDLCQRWMILGAFYPFARNHNAIGQRDQEPYRFPTEIQDNMRRALRWRYALLRYYYTQMYINSIEGGMFWKPLFMEFPEDDNTYKDLNKNIMIGSALKFSPMIDSSNDKTQNFIFPEGIWCSIVSLQCTYFHETSTTQSLPTTPDAINLHLRNGYILPIQRDALNGVMSTSDLDQMRTSLLINLDNDDSTATGRLMIDDGITLSNPTRLDIIFSFSMSDNNHGTLKFNIKSLGYYSQATKLSRIQFLGADYTYIYRCINAQVKGGPAVKGTYDGSLKILTFDFGGLEMDQIPYIDFTK